MKHDTLLTHEFVEFLPEKLTEGIIYISIEHALVAHNCCCGCGLQVITPLSPTDWEMIFNGDSISLYPSIGNWNFPCKSHYWIKYNQVVWAPQWSKAEIDMGRAFDRRTKNQYFNSKQSEPSLSADDYDSKKNDRPENLWKKVKRILWK